MTSNLDKTLASKRKVDLETKDKQIKDICHIWKIILIHPISYLLIIFFICFGVYYEWNLKAMIGIAFEYGIVAVFANLIQYIYQKRLNKPY